MQRHISERLRSRKGDSLRQYHMKSFEICFRVVNWNEETDHVKNGQKIHKKRNRSVFNLCKSTF